MAQTHRKTLGEAWPAAEELASDLETECNRVLDALKYEKAEDATGPSRNEDLQAALHHAAAALDLVGKARVQIRTGRALETLGRGDITD